MVTDSNAAIKVEYRWNTDRTCGNRRGGDRDAVRAKRWKSCLMAVLNWASPARPKGDFDRVGTALAAASVISVAEAENRWMSCNC